MSADAVYVVGDLHAHNDAAFGGVRVAEGASIADEREGDLRFPGCNRRAVETLVAFERVLERAAFAGIRNVLLLGDVFHIKGSVPLAVFNGMTKVLERGKQDLEVSVIAIPGNHDYAGKSSNWSSLNSLYSLPYISGIFEPQVAFVDAGNAKLAALMIPYMAHRSAILSAIERLRPTVAACLRDGRATHAGLFLHTSVKGAVTGPHEYVMRELLDPSDFPYNDFHIVCSGHVHKHQVIKSKGGRFVYCGALLQRNFGERTYTPGHLKLTFLPGEIKVGFVENTESPRFEEARASTITDLERLAALAANSSPPLYMRVVWEGQNEPPERASFVDGSEVRQVELDVVRAPRQATGPRMEVDLFRETPEGLVRRYVARETARAEAAGGVEAVVEDGLEMLRRAAGA